MKKILIVAMLVVLPVLGYAAAPVLLDVYYEHDLGQADGAYVGVFRMSDMLTYIVDQKNQLCFAYLSTQYTQAPTTVDCESLRTTSAIDEFLKAGKEL